MTDGCALPLAGINELWVKHHVYKDRAVTGKPQSTPSLSATSTADETYTLKYADGKLFGQIYKDKISIAGVTVTHAFLAAFQLPSGYATIPSSGCVYFTNTCYR